jgi:type I restriction enzyme, S subunit
VTWSAGTLGEIARRDGGLIQTGPFGSQLHQSDYVADGIPVIMPKDITEGRVDSGSVARVSEATANRPSRHQLRPRTIVLPRRGEITKRAFVRDDQTGWLCGTGCLQIALEGKHLLPEFLYYYMEQEPIARWLEQHAVGTTMLNLSAGIVDELPLRYPVIAVQQRIADILTAYDDLIENNRRRMALLEEAARQLYREWFVRLRFPGHEHTRITNGVPEGWERVPTPEAIEINPTTRLSDEPEHWSVEMADLPTNSMVIQQATRREGRSGSKFRNGDTLFARITPCLENGKTAFVDFLENGETGRGSTEFIVLRARRVTPEYVYCLARTHDFRGNATKSMVGSSGRQRVQESCFEKFLVLIPPGTLLTLFTESIRPKFRQIKTLHEQNQKLRTARDLLLPRLMSGEIAI